MGKNKISVIIPTYNRPLQLRSCLDSLKKQTMPKDEFEIIIIDDGSIPSQGCIVEEYKGDLPNIRYFYQRHYGLGRARNQGIRMSDSDIIVFIDDDNYIESSFLADVSAFLKEHPEISVCHFKIKTDQNILSRRFAHFSYYAWFNYKVNIFNHKNQLRSLVLRNQYENNIFKANFLGVGQGCALRRDIFNKVGLYDEQFIIGEDSDFSLRLKERGIDIWYNPGIEVFHYYRGNLILLAIKEFNMGRNLTKFQNKWPEYPAFNLKTFKGIILFFLSPFVLASQIFLKARSVEEIFLFPFLRFAMQSSCLTGYLAGRLSLRHD